MQSSSFIFTMAWYPYSEVLLYGALLTRCSPLGCFLGPFREMIFIWKQVYMPGTMTAWTLASSIPNLNAPTLKIFQQILNEWGNSYSVLCLLFKTKKRCLRNALSWIVQANIFAQLTTITFVKLVLVQPLCLPALLLALNMRPLLVQAPNPLLPFS